MKKGRMNKILLWGIILNSIRLVLERFTEISDYLSMGILILAIVMMLVGIYIATKDLNADEDNKKAKK